MRAFKLLSLIIASLTLLPSFLLPNEAFADIKTLNGLSGQNQTFQNDSNITVSSANRVHTIGWTGLLPVSRGGTGTGSFTSGSLLFSNGTNITQNNSNLFWDDANNRLGIGTTSPTSTLSVNGSGSVSGNLNVTGTISASNFNPSNYVPYTGATGIVNLGAHNISVGSLSSTNDSIINSLNVGKGGGSIENNTSVGIGALQNNSNGDRKLLWVPPV